MDRKILVALIFLLTLLSISSISISAVSIYDVSVPASIHENDYLNVSFKIANATSDPYAKIFIQGELACETGNCSKFMDYSSSGRYEIKMYAQDNESNMTLIRYSDVLDLPMQLAINHPISSTYNTRSVQLDLNVSTYADGCSYKISGPLSWNDTRQLSGPNNAFFTNIDVPYDGQYALNVSCENQYDSISRSVMFNVDTVAPVITAKSYSLDDSNDAFLSVNTDIASTCKYDTSDKSYEQMNAVFANTNSKTHSTSISRLAEGYYSFYIRCRNYNNLISGASVISFNVVSRPTASITLSKESPLKAGTYEVSVTTSESLPNAPSLYYNFDTDTAPRYVTLTGSGVNWKGYMIISDTSNKVGTFHFSATDFSGNAGNVISKGELFLVDTQKPQPPTSIFAEPLADGSIRLKWYYDSEKPKKFNIYRTSGKDPDYVDYFDSISATPYIDDDVIEGVTYYYRIAAVDDADNDGLLSGLLSATSTRITKSTSGANEEKKETSQTQPPVLDVAFVPKVDSLITELDDYIKSIDSIRSEFASVNDPIELDIIETLETTENMNKAKSKINDLISDAQKLKARNMPLSELDIQINKIRMDAIKAKALVAEDMIIVEESSFDQVTSANDVDMAIKETVAMNISKKVLDAYALDNKKIQDDIVVKTQIVIFKIKYLGKDDYDKFTLVKKTVESAIENNDVSIIELIPKNFESSASDLTFSIKGQSSPMIVNEDPVLRWDMGNLSSKTIYYMTHNNADLSFAKGAKTIVLKRPNFNVTQTIADDTQSNLGLGLLTGFSIMENDGLKKISAIQWLVFIGIGMILGLSIYYVSLDKKSRIAAMQRQKDHRIISRPLTSVDNTQKKSMNNIQNINHIQNMNNVHNRTPYRDRSRTSLTPALEKTSLTKSGVKQDASSPKQIPYEIILSDLDKINELINSFDYDRSRLMFNATLSKFKYVKFNNIDEKKAMKLMLDHIYLKLLIYRTIYDSRKHAAAQDKARLHKDKEIITRAYENLCKLVMLVDDDYKESEQKFINYIIGSIKHIDSLI